MFEHAQIHVNGEQTLNKMKLMKNNNRWVFEQIRPHLGERILEVGSGIGNISEFFVSLDKDLILTDINKDYVEHLQQRFISNPRVNITLHDIQSPFSLDTFPFKIDTVVCLNVLEHIKNDERALENIFEILEQNGRLILLVPALKLLYGSLDAALGHFRRYDKGELVRKLTLRNFLIEKVYYHNFISAFGWFLNARLLKKKLISTTQIKVLDKFVSFLAKLERKGKFPFGLSLVVVCRKGN